MTTKQFLTSKGLLTNDASVFVITGDFGSMTLNELLIEYASLAIDRCKEKAIYYDAEPKCIIDFIENAKAEFNK